MTQVRSQGVFAINLERERQITQEGYDSAHDAGHAEELARAGASYALATYRTDPRPVTQYAPITWPWKEVYWKPTPDDRIRELVKAGALIAAAIDSLLAQTREEGTPYDGADVQEPLT